MEPGKKKGCKGIGLMENSSNSNPLSKSASQTNQPPTHPNLISKKLAHKSIGPMLGIRIEPTSSSNSISQSSSHQLNPNPISQPNPPPSSSVGHGSHSQSLSNNNEQPDSFSESDSESGSDSSNDLHVGEDGFDGPLNDDDNDSNEEGDQNGRGVARRSGNWGTKNKLLLTWNSCYQVIGPNASQYASQLGILVKDGNKLPLTYTDWRAIPEGIKERFWRDIKRNTNLVDACKRVQLMRAAKLWRDWKARVKAKYFTPYKRHRSWLLAHCPSRVDEDQWPLLVDYWSLEDVKNQSKKNRKNRRLMKMPHRTGRKDHANIREELRAQSGKEPSKLEVFIHSRKTTAAKPLDEFTSQKIANLEEEVQKLPETSKGDNNVKDAIYEKVIGAEKPSRVRTYGIGPIPNDIYKNSDGMTALSKEAFDNAVEKRVETIRGELHEEMNVKLTQFKEELITQFEERMRAQFPAVVETSKSASVQLPDQGGDVPTSRSKVELSVQLLDEGEDGPTSRSKVELPVQTDHAKKKMKRSSQRGCFGRRNAEC